MSITSDSHERINKLFFQLSLTIVSIVIGVILYWLYSAPMQAITITPNPIPITTKIVSPGNYALINYNYCKNTSSVGQVSISLVGKYSQQSLPEGSEASKEKCYNNVTAPLPVSPNTVPGVYHFHFEAIYKLNPIRSVTQNFDTQSFTVE